MRRSIAPSQLNSSPKRPRFCPPLAAGRSKQLATVPPQNKDANVQALAPASSGRSTMDVLKLINGLRPACGPEHDIDKRLDFDISQDAFSTEKPIKVANIFGSVATPKPRVPPILNDTSTPVAPQNDEMGNNVSSDASRYFNVVWCKLSKKKHKKWEGDAVLTVRGRTAILRDMDGKEIGRAMGYRLKDVENLEDGSTLPIGGKEIEIMGIIKEDDYCSGRCFQSTVDAATEAGPVSSKRV